MAKIVLWTLPMPIIAALLLAADYAGLLGVRTHTYTDYVTVGFRPRDVTNDAPIPSVFANCALPGSRQACTQNLQGHPERVSLTFALPRAQRGGWIFQRDSRLLIPPESIVRIMFIHPDYQRKVLTLTAAQLAVGGADLPTVNLTPMRESAE